MTSLLDSSHHQHLNGYDNHGYHYNGHHQQGHPNGHQPDGHQPDGHQPNGHQPDEHQPDEHHLDVHQPDEHEPDGHHLDEHQSDEHHLDEHLLDEHHPNGHRHHGPFNQTIYQRYHPSATVITGGTACCFVTLLFCVMPLLVTIIVLFFLFTGITMPVAIILGLLLIVLAVCVVRAFKRRKKVSYT